MSVEKKYMLFCWGAIILTLLSSLNLAMGWIQGIEITVITVILILGSCMTACYIGNKPVKDPANN